MKDNLSRGRSLAQSFRRGSIHIEYFHILLLCGGAGGGVANGAGAAGVGGVAAQGVVRGAEQVAVVRDDGVGRECPAGWAPREYSAAPVRRQSG